MTKIYADIEASTGRPKGFRHLDDDATPPVGSVEISKANWQEYLDNPDERKFTATGRIRTIPYVPPPPPTAAERVAERTAGDPVMAALIRALENKLGVSRGSFILDIEEELGTPTL